MTEPVHRLRSALADRYRIEHELGQGGMATIYLAHDLRHERRVAIKVLRPDLAAVIGANRFLREIKTIAHLQHPHILGLIDSGEVGGTAYYVMPFVEGESLRARLQREKQLPVAETVRIACEIAHVAFDQPVILDEPWTDAFGRQHAQMVGRPVATHAMRGISAHSNGFHTCRALHLLQMLIGSVASPLSGASMVPTMPAVATSTVLLPPASACVAASINALRRARRSPATASMTGSAMAGQWLLVRRAPESGRYAAIANFGMAGVFSAAAIHNAGIKRTAPAVTLAQ